jgi:hypothetical protein
MSHTCRLEECYDAHARALYGYLLNLTIPCQSRSPLSSGLFP